MSAPSHQKTAHRISDKGYISRYSARAFCPHSRTAEPNSCIPDDVPHQNPYDSQATAYHAVQRHLIVQQLLDARKTKCRRPMISSHHHQGESEFLSLHPQGKNAVSGLIIPQNQAFPAYPEAQSDGFSVRPGGPVSEGNPFKLHLYQ